MPRGYPLSDHQKLAIYNAYTSGEKQIDIASTYGVAVGTVSKVVNDQRRNRQMASREKIVAGDKAHGRLVSTADPYRYEGTCIIAGKRHKKMFTTVNAKKATELWEKWCQDLRDEREFMDMVERKPKDGDAVCGSPNDPIEEIEPTTTAEPNLDSAEQESVGDAEPTIFADDIEVTKPIALPVIEVRPWRDIADERQERIEMLEARIAELEASDPLRPDWVIERTEQDKPILEHWFNDNGAFSVVWMDKPVYVLWAKSDDPKIYGIYRTMDAALVEVDRLNDVAAFLTGNNSTFEVEEVAWKGTK